MNTYLFASVENMWLLAGWTMIHFLWLGTLVALAALLSRWLLRRASANMRYAVAIVCLAILTAMPIAIATWLREYSPSMLAADLPLRNEAAGQVVELKNLEPTALATPPAIAKSDVPMAVQPAQQAPPSDSAIAIPPPALTAPSITDPLSLTVVAINRSVQYLPWLWLIGTPITFAVTATGLIGTRRLRRASCPITSGPISEALEKLAKSLRLSRRVAVATCDRIIAPVLIGILRPIILLPPAALTGYSPDEIEMVLLHELAHVRRWDNFVNLLQRIVESLLFFHPAVWLISSWARREREACCDALVVARTDHPYAYAELLVALAAQMPRSVLFHPTASSAMAAGPLRSRIRRILKLEDDPMLISGKSFVFLLAAIIATVALAVLYLPSIGQAEQPKADAKVNADADTPEKKIIVNPPGGLESRDKLQKELRELQSEIKRKYESYIDIAKRDRPGPRDPETDLLIRDIADTQKKVEELTSGYYQLQTDYLIAKSELSDPKLLDIQAQEALKHDSQYADLLEKANAQAAASDGSEYQVAEKYRADFKKKAVREMQNKPNVPLQQLTRRFRTNSDSMQKQIAFLTQTLEQKKKELEPRVGKSVDLARRGEELKKLQQIANDINAALKQPDIDVEVEPLVFELKADGSGQTEILLNGNRATEDSIRKLLRERVASNTDQPVSITADKSINYAEVMRIVDLLESLGIKKLALDTRHTRSRDATDAKVANAPSDESAASIAAKFPHEVQFEKGAAKFLEGDAISIDEVRGTAKTFEPGNQYWIKGTYKLHSHDRAQISAFTTAREAADGTGPIQSVQTKQVSGGDKAFTLILPMSCRGWPHVSFYPADNGGDFGGIYFGTGDSVLKEWWGSEKSQSAADDIKAKKQQVKTINNLKNLGIALLNYHDTNHHLPASAIYSPDGTPLLSWRVAILPFVDPKLYDEFHLDEPWNSEHNRKLIARMPDLFKNPKLDKQGMTNYLAVAGEECVFNGTREGLSIKNITDGTANTIAVVEANTDLATEWTRPQDWNFDRAQPTRGLGQLWPRGWYGAWVDGSVSRVENSKPADQVGIQFTRSGGETKSLQESANRTVTEGVGPEAASGAANDASFADPQPSSVVEPQVIATLPADWQNAESTGREEVFKAIAAAQKKNLRPDIVQRGGKVLLVATPQPTEKGWPEMLGDPPRKERVIAEKAWQQLGLKLAPLNWAETIYRENVTGQTGGILIVGGNVPKGLPLPSVLVKLDTDTNSVASMDSLLGWLGNNEGRPLPDIKCYAVADGKEYLFESQPPTSAGPTNTIQPAPDLTQSMPTRHRFPSLEDQKLADLAWKRLQLEIEPIGPEELNRVKSRGYEGGVMVANVATHSGAPAALNEIQSGDILVGLHVWPVTSLQDVAAVLKRDDLADLNPLKFYAVRPHADANDNIVEISGRITVKESRPATQGTDPWTPAQPPTFNSNNTPTLSPAAPSFIAPEYEIASRGQQPVRNRNEPSRASVPYIPKVTLENQPSTAVRPASPSSPPLPAIAPTMPEPASPTAPSATIELRPEFLKRTFADRSSSQEHSIIVTEAPSPTPATDAGALKSLVVPKNEPAPTPANSPAKFDANEVHASQSIAAANVDPRPHPMFQGDQRHVVSQSTAEQVVKLAADQVEAAMKTKQSALTKRQQAKDKDAVDAAKHELEAADRKLEEAKRMFESAKRQLEDIRRKAPSTAASTPALGTPVLPSIAAVDSNQAPVATPSPVGSYIIPNTEQVKVAERHEVPVTTKIDAQAAVKPIPPTPARDPKVAKPSDDQVTIIAYEIPKDLVNDVAQYIRQIREAHTSWDDRGRLIMQARRARHDELEKLLKFTSQWRDSAAAKDPGITIQKVDDEDVLEWTATGLTFMRDTRPDHSVPNGPGGVYVSAVVPGSPAAWSDVRPGDIVAQVGSFQASSVAELASVIKTLREGYRTEKKLVVGFYRRTPTGGGGWVQADFLLKPETADPNPNDSGKPPAVNSDNAKEKPTSGRKSATLMRWRDAIEGGDARPRSASIDKAKLHYEGKSFDEWRTAWQSELSTDKRIEAVKALAAFGANGYGPDAAKAIVEIAGQYDWTSIGGNEAADTLKKACLGAFGYPGTSTVARPIPENDVLLALLAAVDSKNTNDRLFATWVLSAFVPQNKVAAEALQKLSSDTDAKVRSYSFRSMDVDTRSARDNGIPPRIRQELMSNDPKMTRVAIKTLVKDAAWFNSRGVSMEKGPALYYIPELFPLLFAPDESVRKEARQALRFITKANAEQVVEQLLSILDDDARRADHIEAIRAIAAMGPKASPALDKLQQKLSTSDPKIRIPVAAAIKMIVGKDQYQKPVADVLGEELGITVARTSNGMWGALPRDENAKGDAFFRFTEDVIKEQEVLFPPDDNKPPK